MDKSTVADELPGLGHLTLREARNEHWDPGQKVLAFGVEGDPGAHTEGNADRSPWPWPGPEPLKLTVQGSAEGQAALESVWEPQVQGLA